MLISKYIVVKQGTVNLVIIAAAIVVAAGAWGAPLMTVQTTHSIITSELASTESSIKDNTNIKTAAVTTATEKSLSGGMGDSTEEGKENCNLMQMMMMSAMGKTKDQLGCSMSGMEGMMESQSGFDNKAFHFEEEFLETLPGVIIPNENCLTGALFTDAEILTGTTVTSGGSTGTFGNAACIQPLNSTSSPITINQMTIQTAVAVERDVRIQLAVIENKTAADSCGSDPALFFANSTAYDGVVRVPSQGSVTVPIMLDLPPNSKDNLCGRIADDGAGKAFEVILSGVEAFPLEVFKFVPPSESIQFSSFTKADFSSTCAMALKVTANNGTALSGIPVELLEPYVSPSVNAEQITNATGYVTIGAGNLDFSGDEELPSGFMVIDVNLGPNSNDNFGNAFPDQPISCSNAEEDGYVTTNDVKLQQFGGSGMIGSTLEVIVNDKDTLSPIAGASVTYTYSSQFGSSPGTTFAVTDTSGETKLTNVPPGKYVLTVSKSGYITESNVVMDVFPGMGFAERFVDLTAAS